MLGLKVWALPGTHWCFVRVGVEGGPLDVLLAVFLFWPGNSLWVPIVLFSHTWDGFYLQTFKRERLT